MFHNHRYKTPHAPQHQNTCGRTRGYEWWSAKLRQRSRVAAVTGRRRRAWLRRHGHASPRSCVAASPWSPAASINRTRKMKQNSDKTLKNATDIYGCTTGTARCEPPYPWQFRRIIDNYMFITILVTNTGDGIKQWRWGGFDNWSAKLQGIYVVKQSEWHSQVTLQFCHITNTKCSFEIQSSTLHLPNEPSSQLPLPVH